MVTIKKTKFDLNTVITKYSVLMLILSVLLLAVGVLFCVTPLGVTSVVIWIAFGLLALMGLGGVLKFIFPGKGNSRDISFTVPISQMELAQQWKAMQQELSTINKQIQEKSKNKNFS